MNQKYIYIYIFIFYYIVIDYFDTSYMIYNVIKINLGFIR